MCCVMVILHESCRCDDGADMTDTIDLRHCEDFTDMVVLQSSLFLTIMSLDMSFRLPIPQQHQSQ